MGNFIKRNFIEMLAWGCLSIGCIVFIIYLLILGHSDYSLLDQISDEDIERTGQIGDFFGGIVGSTWALAGVLLYFSALRLQSKQLANQIEEMNENKKLMSQQQFETTFFNLLKTQQELKNDIKGYFYSVNVSNEVSHRVVETEHSSNDFFIRVLNEMRILYSIYKRSKFAGWSEQEADEELLSFYEEHAGNPEEPYSDYKKEINEMYYRFNQCYLTSQYKIKEDTVKKAQAKETEELMCRCIYGHIYIKYQNQLGHYFRHLYNIVKFLDQEKQRCLDEAKDNITKADDREAEVKIIERRFSGYVAFIHSMLSTGELSVLFYNSLLFPKAEELCVKYKIFDNLLEENLLKKRHSQLMKGIELKNSNTIFQDIIKDLQREVDE